MFWLKFWISYWSFKNHSKHPSMVFFFLKQGWRSSQVFSSHDLATLFIWKKMKNRKLKCSQACPKLWKTQIPYNTRKTLCMSVYVHVFSNSHSMFCLLVVEWSVKGSYIALAKEDILIILSSNLKERSHMVLPFKSWTSDSDENCIVKGTYLAYFHFLFLCI